MRYVVSAVAVVYAALCIYAAGTQRKDPCRRTSVVLMISGGLLLLLAAALELAGWSPAWLLAVIGGLLICQAALLNGRRNGRVHLRHHAVRFFITVLLVAGFAVW